MYNKLKYLKIVFFLFSAVLFFDSCKNNPTANTVNAENEHAKEEEKNVNSISEVHLNEAQFKATGLVFGAFEKKNLSNVIIANGYTKLPPQNQAQVNVPMPGNIKTIKVLEGQFVKKGQILATLQSIAYNNLRLEREKLTEQLKQSEANLGYLQLEFARQKELSDENVNAKKVFQKVSADVNVEENKVKALQNQIGILNQNIEIGGNSNSPIINILAPISGHVTDVNVNIGTAVEVGKPIFTIVDNSQMHVDLLVYEKDLNQLKVGQPVRFNLTNQNNSEFKGKVFSIGKAFENETKSVAVHADIINDKHTLISGMYINALIDIGKNLVDALPQEAIVKADGREYIFVLEGEEKGEYHFQRIEVKTGVSQLGFVQITPLQNFENKKNIVVKGAFYLQSHLQVEEGGEGGHDH